MIARQQVRSTADLVLTVGMIALLRVPQEIAVSFDGVPPDATSVTIADSRDGAIPHVRERHALQGGRLATLSAAPGHSVIVMFSRADGIYMVEGPFTWPDVAATRSVDHEWRRTVTSSGNEDIGQPPLEWVSSSQGAGPWPQCAWVAGDRWQCWGAPARSAGVVATQHSGRTYWSVVTQGAGSAAPLQSSGWARLIRLRSSDLLKAAEAHLRRPVPPPPQRLRSIRLETADVRATVTPVSDDVLWIASDESPPGAWVEVLARDAGPTIVPVQEIASGLPSVPYAVWLPPTGGIGGRVVDASGAPAASALVSLFRLIDPPETAAGLSRGEPRARRVGAGEAITGSDGTFAFEKLPEGNFEVLIWHGQMGRTSTLVRSPATDVAIRIAPRAVVGGRVLAHGTPAGDVPVVSVPDAAAVGTADDLTELKGGDGRTGPDGRFVVALADRGGGELRIGGGATGLRRVPLPRGAAGSLDLGDVDLPALVTVTFVVDQDPGCDLVAVGPLGHTGLQIVPTRRTHPGMFAAVLPEEGDWRVTLSCGEVERMLIPPLVKVAAGTGTVNLHVR